MRFRKMVRGFLLSAAFLAYYVVLMSLLLMFRCSLDNRCSPPFLPMWASGLLIFLGIVGVMMLVRGDFQRQGK